MTLTSDDTNDALFLKLTPPLEKITRLLLRVMSPLFLK